MQYKQEDIQKVIQRVADAVIHAMEEIELPPPSNMIQVVKRYTANFQGFITLPNVDQWLATLKPSEREKLPNRFNFPSAHGDTEYPNDEARRNARQYLSNRNWGILGQRMLECYPIEWVTLTKKGSDIPWDEPNYFTLRYNRQNGFIPNAWSWGWDDKDVDAVKVLELVKAFHAGQN